MTEWNKILREEIYSPKEPEESVIRFLEGLKKKRLRVLDLGCGRGRHVIYMMKQGFEAHGIDLSDMGLKTTKEKLESGSEWYLVKGDMKVLPYAGSYFDAVVSLRSIYHQTVHGLQQTISEIRRVLDKDGSVLIDFLSKRTYSYGKGTYFEENTFIGEEGLEKGVFHHFTDKEDLERLFKGFKIVNIELREKEVDGKLRSRWIVEAKA
jgi:ubiquinone/menaquinone biosynthesis C-methylase UbiE